MSEQGWIFAIGIAAAIVAYLAKNFVLEPLMDFRKLRGKIQNRLMYHANIITNDEFPQDFVKPIREELRQLSCDLGEVYFAIPFRSWLWWLFIIPQPKNLDEATRQLIFLSNSTGSKDSVRDNHKSMESVQTILKLKKT